MMTTVLLIILGLALALWIAGSVFMYTTQESKYYPGDGATFGEHESIRALGGNVFTAEREGQALRWYEIAARSGPARGWLIVYHGNSDGAAERADYGQELSAIGFNVVLAEYPGYAGDKSPTGEWEILRNALAIYDEIKAKAEGAAILLLGESLGSGVATFVASRRPCAALILSTPYTSMADVAAYRYPLLPVKPLTTHPVQSKKWARHVDAPVLILHGTADKTVPYFQGQRQAKNFKNLKGFITLNGAHHSNMRDFNGGKFWKSIAEFTANALGPQVQAAV